MMEERFSAAPVQVDEVAYLADIAERITQSWPENVPHEAKFQNGRVPASEYVRAWTRLQADCVAIVFYGREITYRELDDYTERMASWLVARSVKPGDRTGICSTSASVRRRCARSGLMALNSAHRDVLAI